MEFIVTGTNHRYSPLAFREKLSSSGKALERFLAFLKTEGRSSAGLAVLSTCNRFEIYAIARNGEETTDRLKGLVSNYKEIRRKEIERNFYAYKGMEAVKHLFSVSSGTDSLVPGEIQILSQVKEAFRKAKEAGLGSEALAEIFSGAESVARKVRSMTRISEGKVSIGSVAVDFIKWKIKDFAGKVVLLVGTGKVTELVLKYLIDEGPSVVCISNRTYEKARGMARGVGAKAVRMDKLGTMIKGADIVITATQSPHFVIKKRHVAKVKRSGLLILDLAVPRDVEPAVGMAANVSLYSLEDLEKVIRKNFAQKEKELLKARDIIERESDKTWGKYTLSRQEPVLSR